VRGSFGSKDRPVWETAGFFFFRYPRSALSTVDMQSKHSPTLLPPTDSFGDPNHSASKNLSNSLFLLT
jgi:hypothetical protein